MNSKILFLVVFFIQTLAIGDSTGVAHKSEKVNRGGFLSRLLNRSSLQEYSELIHERKINLQQLKSYLEQGGTVDTLKNYSVTKDFFVGDPAQPVANLFISRQKLYEGEANPAAGNDSRTDRIGSLQILLENGADPNLNPDVQTKEALAPVLFALWTQDHEAFKVIIKNGGNVNLTQKVSSEVFGPALLVVQDDKIADEILSVKPDLGFKFSNGRNLLQELIYSTHFSPQHILSRLRWMQKNEILFQWPIGGDSDPVLRAQQMVKFLEENQNPQRPMDLQTWKEILSILPQLKNKI